MKAGGDDVRTPIRRALSGTWTIVYLICCLSLQSQPVTNPTNNTPANTPANNGPTNPPSNGTPITNGNTLIEATLFAYRALSSDVAAIAFEIKRSDPKKIVIGTQADVTAFSQWRVIMEEASLLHDRAQNIAKELAQANIDFLKIPKPQLSISVAHGAITASPNPQKVIFTITVENALSPTAGPTQGPVTVQLPAGWTNFQFSKGAWSCDSTTTPPSCTEQNTLWPGNRFPPLIIAVPLTLKTQADLAVPFELTVSNGNSVDTWKDILLPPVLTVNQNPPGDPDTREVTVTLTMSNAPTAGSTTGQVTVTYDLPAGSILGAAGAKGSGWVCTATTGNPIKVTCLRDDPLDPPLQPGHNYPPVKVDVVTPGAPAGPNFLEEALPGEAAAIAANVSAVEGVVSTGAQILSALTSQFAVSQTLTPAQVTLKDIPLINMLTRYLVSYKMNVYVPSVYAPNLLAEAKPSDTYLWKELTYLEADREVLLTLMANSVSPKTPPATPPSVVIAAGKVQTLASAAQTLISNIDAFENSLFGGQILSAPAPSTNQSQTPQPKPQPPPTNPPSCSTPPCTQVICVTAACPQQTTQDTSGAKTPQTPNQPPTTPAASNPLVTPQILAADLVVHQLFGNSKPDVKEIKFLSVSSLDAGGGQIKKTSKFYGDHIFFSGGAVLTFSLFNMTGEVTCSGVAYNYEGNIREKNFEKSLRAPQLPAIVNTDFPCTAAPIVNPKNDSRVPRRQSGGPGGLLSPSGPADEETSQQPTPPASPRANPFETLQQAPQTPDPSSAGSLQRAIPAWNPDRPSGLRAGMTVDQVRMGLNAASATLHCAGAECIYSAENNMTVVFPQGKVVAVRLSGSVQAGTTWRDVERTFKLQLPAECKADDGCRYLIPNSENPAAEIHFRNGTIAKIILPDSIRRAKSEDELANALNKSSLDVQCAGKTCTVTAGPFQIDFEAKRAGRVVPPSPWSVDTSVVITPGMTMENVSKSLQSHLPLECSSGGKCHFDLGEQRIVFKRDRVIKGSQTAAPSNCDVRVGMTVADVVAACGAAYRSFAAKGDIYIYEYGIYQDSVLSRVLRVVFKNGKVLRTKSIPKP